MKLAFVRHLRYLGITIILLLFGVQALPEFVPIKLPFCVCLLKFSTYIMFMVFLINIKLLLLCPRVGFQLLMYLFYI
ncbi:hypothetical protein Syun_019528 [Stephania yunnanensis]|uniref:Uncharacterized protein n=1 Tax=Stephania yunnanensis TaxID=152371 RepID=A0AAP0IUA4_9MAGN